MTRYEVTLDKGIDIYTSIMTDSYSTSVLIETDNIDKIKVWVMDRKRNEQIIGLRVTTQELKPSQSLIKL